MIRSGAHNQWDNKSIILSSISDCHHQYISRDFCLILPLTNDLQSRVTVQARKESLLPYYLARDFCLILPLPNALPSTSPASSSRDLSVISPHFSGLLHIAARICPWPPLLTCEFQSFRIHCIFF